MMQLIQKTKMIKLKKFLFLILFLFTSPNFAMELHTNKQCNEFSLTPDMPILPKTLDMIFKHLDETDNLVDRIHFFSTCTEYYNHGRRIIRKEHPDMDYLIWHQIRFETLWEYEHFNYLTTLAVGCFLKISDRLGRNNRTASLIESLQRHQPILKQSCQLFNALLIKAQSAQDLYFEKTRHFLHNIAEEQPLIPLLKLFKNYALGNIRYEGIGWCSYGYLSKDSLTAPVLNCDWYQDYIEIYCELMGNLEERMDEKYAAEYGLHAAVFTFWIGQREYVKISKNDKNYIILQRPFQWYGHHPSGFKNDSHGVYKNGKAVNLSAYEYPNPRAENFLELCHPHFESFLNT